MEQVILHICALLREGKPVDDAKITALCRAANAGVCDVSRHISKKKLLPFYLRVRESEQGRFASWDIDSALEESLLAVLRTKPRRTASGVATITVITKPWPCGSNCLYCPNDLRMPKSYIYDEPACRRAERNYFDPYLQVASRLFTLEQMGHVTDKIELIVLGGTWTDYPAAYRRWFVCQLFAALNDDDATRRSRVACLRRAYQDAGISCDDDELAQQVVAQQQRVDKGGSTYNDAWGALYGGTSVWAGVAAWQQANIESILQQHELNECGRHRVVGLVVETRPEALDIEVLAELRLMGATKVQIGVQTLDPDVMACNRRPGSLEQVERAFALLRAFGFKIHAHFMANLYGSNPAADVEDYRRFVSDLAFCPDEVKLYPCALIGGTELARVYEKGLWQPYTEQELLEVLVANVLATPPYIRISRMIRDFCAQDILAGVKKTNFRQMVERELAAQGSNVAEIRFREIGCNCVDAAGLRLDCFEYDATLAHECFLQWVDDQGRIAGFLRLSLPKDGMRSALGELPDPLGQAMIREVHVYGKVAAIDAQGHAAQHMGLGKKLIERACAIAKDAGFAKVNVISAVGTRNYYRARGFYDNGLYQTRDL